MSSEITVLNEIVQEQRAQIAQLVSQVEDLKLQFDLVLNERNEAMAESASAKSVHQALVRNLTSMSEFAGKAMRERDAARRLLKAVVDMMRDNMAHDATHPHHLCDFIHRPDIGMCKVCEDWTDAMVMCYPDDFQDEEDGK